MQKAFIFKACPFCGGKNLDIQDKESFSALQGEHGAAALVIRCNDCYVEMWEHSHEIKVYAKRLELLAKKWNRRAEVDHVD